ncbi:hypothetical protein B296_00032636 [Ensete ventricosum]|uniref:Uncharacterized protein n=1 Tax=Ensete ventricosum TaxID=4639 RepID=A0A427AD59_ENSVE|nr:hypothetical protein B296_00032636 [Ensete ventricosum]
MRRRHCPRMVAGCAGKQRYASEEMQLRRVEEVDSYWCDCLGCRDNREQRQQRVLEEAREGGRGESSGSDFVRREGSRRLCRGCEGATMGCLSIDVDGDNKFNRDWLWMQQETPNLG